MSIADLARRVGKLAIDNSPTILTSVGVAGAITTALMVGKASWQASDIIRIKEGLDYRSDEDRRDSREVLKDRTKLVWTLYIPAAATGAATIVCIIGANRVGARRMAALGAATAIIERSFDEYKDKVLEKFGERKELQIRDEIVHDRINATYKDDVRLLGVNEGEICYDSFGGQYFLSSVEGINAAVNVLNNTINHDGYASLADLYRLLDMETPAFSENLGWNHNRLLEVRIGADLAHESKPIITMNFRNDPESDYSRFH